ncbi:MAG: tetratricopeptide repeat protein [Terriglobales bacterium]
MNDVVDKLLAQAQAERREYRYSDANGCLIEAVAICRNAGAHTDMAPVLANLGQIKRDLHDLDSARDCYIEAVSIYREQGAARKLAHAIRHLGDVHQELDDLKSAEACYREALILYRAESGTPPLELANAIRSVAILRDRMGEGEKAILLWTEARDLYATANVQTGVDECTKRMAGVNRDDFRL